MIETHKRNNINYYIHIDHLPKQKAYDVTVYDGRVGGFTIQLKISETFHKYADYTKYLIDQLDHARKLACDEEH